MQNFPGMASWLEINKSNLLSNVKLFRSYQSVSPQFSSLGVVLKGNAYGHGLLSVLECVHSLVDIVFVISPEDAKFVRDYESKRKLPKLRVVVLGAITVSEAAELAELEIEAVVAGCEWKDFGADLAKQKLVKKLKLHIHIDSGLCREGFLPDSLETDLQFLKDLSATCEIVGALSHFANTEDVTEQEYAAEQVNRFELGLKKLEALLGGKRLERHIAASAATLLLPQARLDSVRVGISLYGLWPSKETRLSAKIVLPELPKLKPVLSWRCESQVVKWLPQGSFVGYGCTYRCAQRTRVAVLPVGYFDGYPRSLSSKAHVLINGERCPLLGRVMMNHLVVDVTKLPGDFEKITATLLGEDGKDAISAETLADWAQTINYEIVARIPIHLKRVLI